MFRSSSGRRSGKQLAAAVAAIAIGATALVGVSSVIEADAHSCDNKGPKDTFLPTRNKHDPINGRIPGGKLAKKGKSSKAVPASSKKKGKNSKVSPVTGKKKALPKVAWHSCDNKAPEDSYKNDKGETKKCGYRGKK